MALYFFGHHDSPSNLAKSRYQNRWHNILVTFICKFNCGQYETKVRLLSNLSNCPFTARLEGNTKNRKSIVLTYRMRLFYPWAELVRSWGIWHFFFEITINGQTDIRFTPHGGYVFVRTRSLRVLLAISLHLALCVCWILNCDDSFQQFNHCCRHAYRCQSWTRRGESRARVNAKRTLFVCHTCTNSQIKNALQSEILNPQHPPRSLTLCVTYRVLSLPFSLMIALSHTDWRGLFGATTEPTST